MGCHSLGVLLLSLEALFDLIVLFYIGSVNKTRSLLYIKVHEEKKALIKDISRVNRLHLTVMFIVENIYTCCIASLHSRVLKSCKVVAFKRS